MEIAAQYGATVVSADAMTVWRGLDVGTAKPTAEERLRVPHRCIDVRDLHEEFNVADFLDEVDAARLEGGRVVIAGGTPFYLAGLVRPMAILPAPNHTIRAELNVLADPWTYLQEVDPVLAAKLHPNDRVRIIRALEVYRITGEPMSQRQKGPPARAPIAAKVAWLDRDDLRERISTRLQEMRGRGYVEETRRVLEQGTPHQHRVLRSFAYRHIVEHIVSGLDLDEAFRRTERDTWRLARKQRTWSRGLGWLAAAPDDAHEFARTLWGSPPK